MLRSDKLRRVQEKRTSDYESTVEILEIKKMDILWKGQWAIFTNSENLTLIGMVIDFAFMDETKLKDIAYTKDFAYTSNNAKLIGVCCVWYKCNEHLQLMVTDQLVSQGYIDIGTYVVSIPSPNFNNSLASIQDKFKTDIMKYLNLY